MVTQKYLGLDFVLFLELYNTSKNGGFIVTAVNTSNRIYNISFLNFLCLLPPSFMFYCFCVYVSEHGDKAQQSADANLSVM
jgi:hypothetical protein